MLVVMLFYVDNYYHGEACKFVVMARVVIGEKLEQIEDGII